MASETSPAAEPGGVFVRMGARMIAITGARPVRLHTRATPTMAVAPVRCDGCRTITMLAAKISFHFYDGDHLGRLEVWYRSQHAAPCAHCHAPLELELGYTQTSHAGSSEVELCLDCEKRRSGGALAPIAGLAPPALANEAGAA
jgi:hypothetical protein